LAKDTIIWLSSWTGIADESYRGVSVTQWMLIFAVMLWRKRYRSMANLKSLMVTKEVNLHPKTSLNFYLKLRLKLAWMDGGDTSIIFLLRNYSIPLNNMIGIYEIEDRYQLNQKVKNWIKWYNKERLYQALNYKMPCFYCQQN
jgi:hypothetical protein